MSSAQKPTWQALLKDDRVEPHRTNAREIVDVRALVARNLKDAGVKGLSADNRFGLAYEAALILAKMVIAAAGYRVRGQSAHFTTFEALEVAMGEPSKPFSIYFDRCRRKRNTLSYDAAGVVTETEAAEILKLVEAFRTLVEEWLKAQPCASTSDSRSSPDSRRPD